jgi:hypothetical protein
MLDPKSLKDLPPAFRYSAALAYIGIGFGSFALLPAAWKRLNGPPVHLGSALLLAGCIVAFGVAMLHSAYSVVRPGISVGSQPVDLPLERPPFGLWNAVVPFSIIAAVAGILVALLDNQFQFMERAMIVLVAVALAGNAYRHRARERSQARDTERLPSSPAGIDVGADTESRSLGDPRSGMTSNQRFKPTGAAHSGADEI